LYASAFFERALIAIEATCTIRSQSFAAPYYRHVMLRSRTIAIDDVGHSEPGFPPSVQSISQIENVDGTAFERRLIDIAAARSGFSAGSVRAPIRPGIS
jgi:hypothetical protein